jgi:hypothetical protein
VWHGSRSGFVDWPGGRSRPRSVRASRQAGPAGAPGHLLARRPAAVAYQRPSLRLWVMHVASRSSASAAVASSSPSRALHCRRVRALHDGGEQLVGERRERQRHRAVDLDRAALRVARRVEPPRDRGWSHAGPSAVTVSRGGVLVGMKGHSWCRLVSGDSHQVRVAESLSANAPSHLRVNRGHRHRRGESP